MRRIFLLLTTLFVAFGAFAQEAVPPAGQPISLKECVDIALKNNLRIRRGYYNVQSFNVNLLQSKAAFLPTLNAGSTYGFNFGRALNPVTNTIEARNSRNLNVQLTSGLTLFNGFRLQNTYRQNRKDVEAANMDLEKAKNDVILNVVTLYINVIFNKELFENNKYQLSSSQQQLERIKRQVEAGSLPRANQLNQEATVATNEVNLINQENALNLSLLQLKQAMQLPSSQVLDVEIPELQLEDIILDQTPDEIYQISLKTMPEIKSAVLKVESADLALKAAKGNLYPRLTANGSFSSNYTSLQQKNGDITGFNVTQGDPNFPIGFANVNGFNIPITGYQYSPIRTSEKYTEFEQLKDYVAKQVGFTMNIPIFNGLQTRTAVQRAAIQSELAGITEVETQNTLRQSIESAYNDAFAASKTYAASLKQVSAREEAYRMTQQRFDLGAVSFVEKQISENDLFQSKSDLTRAKYNFIFKKKILDFYQGKSIEY